MDQWMFTALGVHRALVHYPIALLAAGSVFEVAGRALGNSRLRTAASYVLLTGLASAVAAAVAGLAAATDPDMARHAEALARHRALGIATILLFAFAIIWKFVTERNRSSFRGSVYVAALLAGAAMTVATGYYGGEMGHSAVHDDGACSHDDPHTGGTAPDVHRETHH
ncbi:MAG: DUF2231 domain-containing protein [Armatimonadota bacterium]|nr:DUF2231 domain-containing protein [Armatimonadota bacterium]